MNVEIQNEKLRKAHQEAAEWLILLDCDASDKTIKEFNKWRTADPSHDEAFLDATKAWSGSGALHKLTEIHPERVPAEFRKIVQFASGRSDLKKFLRPTLALAALAGVAILSILIWRQGENSPQIGSIYKTDVGEQAVITLRDGSTLNLNTDSEVRVVFTKARREIHLSRGEALFNVQAAPTQPFIVYAGQGRVLATDASFRLFIRPDDTEVSVMNGLVEVNNKLMGDNGRSTPASRMASAQQRIVYNNVLGDAVPVDPVQLERSISWKQGMLNFDGWTLDKVVAEVNRYRQEKIEIKDESLKSLTIGGVFKITQLDSLPKLLATDYNIRIEHAGPDSVVLYRR